jgi:hypothetical protein
LLQSAEENGTMSPPVELVPRKCRCENTAGRRIDDRSERRGAASASAALCLRRIAVSDALAFFEAPALNEFARFVPALHFSFAHAAGKVHSSRFCEDSF